MEKRNVTAGLHSLRRLTKLIALIMKDGTIYKNTTKVRKEGEL